jgi:hypothetical protein
MIKKIRFNDPNKLSARHILLNGSSIDIAYRGEYPEYYLYQIGWSHSTDWSEISIYKDFDIDTEATWVVFENKKKGISKQLFWKIVDLKDRDKLLTKMIGLQKKLK